jgi:hypothetical protein
VIHAQGLTKRYGDTLAVDSLSFDVLPGRVERATLTSPSYGGWQKLHDPHIPYLHFAPGKYTWISDAREIYWSASATSEFDGKPGAYVQLNGGQRYVSGEWTAGEPNLPAGV